jgi:hypothetical protein
MELRMSEGSLRRAIRDGQVLAEQRRRNPDSATDQRMVYEVWIPDATDPPGTDAHSETTQSPDTRQTPATETPAAVIRLIEELGAMVRESREQSVSDLLTIAELRERVGRAEAVVEMLQRQTDRWLGEANLHLERAIGLEAERDALARELERLRAPWWRRLLG